MKRLIYDIETSPNIGLFWQPGRKVNISYESIIKERAIICICYKWENKRVQSLTWDKNQCDKRMVAEFVELLHESDEAVAHNGDKFDIKWIRGRAIIHRIPMSPYIVTVDTYKLARTAYLNSYRLDFLGTLLASKGKIKTDFQMWKDILIRKDPVAMTKMVRYCKRDVNLLEKVFKVLKPYAKPKTSVTTDRNRCPECGGPMERHKDRKLASGARQTQLRCTACGKYNTIPTSKVK